MLLHLAPLSSFFVTDPVNIASTTSLLHQATAIVLIMFSLLLASGQFLGSPMNCVVDDFPDSIPKSHIDDYCFVQTTFIALNQMDPTLVGKQTAHRGVGAGFIEPKDRKDNSFYQWVCFVLCFQGFCFYFPHFMWSLWEGGMMKMLAMDLNGAAIPEDKKDERKKLLVEYFSKNLHRNKTYALGFFLSEFLSLGNVIGQISFTNWFLGGQFMNYGRAVLGINNEKMWDASEAMAVVFPKMGKCTYQRFGPSGTVQILDAICLLNHNAVNEKIYIFLFVVFCLLTLVSGLVNVYRIAVICIRPLRTLLLKVQTPLTPSKDVETVSKNFHPDDWFVLRLLGRNINPVAFNELVSDLAAKLRNVDRIVSDGHQPKFPHWFMTQPS